MRSLIRVGSRALRRSRTRRLGTVLALTATVAAAFAAAASAGPVFRETIHDEFEFVDDDFCGAGLTGKWQSSWTFASKRSRTALTVLSTSCSMAARPTCSRIWRTAGP
jgi:hypothetical protein